MQTCNNNTLTPSLTMSCIMSIPLASGPFLLKHDGDDCVYVVAECLSMYTIGLVLLIIVEIKESREVSWDADTRREAFACFCKALYTGDYGDITSAAMENIGTSNEYYFSVSLAKLMTEEEAKTKGFKLIPDIIYMRLPAGDVVQIPVKVFEHDLFEIFTFIPCK